MNHPLAVNSPLSGVIVPLITPYKPNAEINQTALKTLIDRVIAAGVDAVMVSGTTGEFALLSFEERKLLAELTIKYTAGRVPTAIQVGSVTTHESLTLAEHAVRHGADAVSVICPYYFGLPDSALVDHFCQVAQAVPENFPVYLYNFPQRTGNHISPTVSAAVAERCPNVVGEKDSSGDLNLMVAKRQVRAGIFNLLVGNDALILPALTLGVRGAVAGIANVFPELFVDLLHAYRQNDLPAAEQAQEKIHIATSIFNGNIALIKAAMQSQGLDVGGARAPLSMALPPDSERLLDHLRQAGLLQV